VRIKGRKKALRRHTEAAGHLLLAQSTAFLRRRFSSVVTTTLAIIRLKSRLAKRSESKKYEKEKEKEKEEEKEKEKESLSPAPTPIQVHCRRCNHDHDLSDAPHVVWVCFPCLSSLLSHLVQISISPCTKEQRTWEDSNRKGKGMTDVRCFPRISDRIDRLD
jgi:hypothetical protein